MFLLEQQEIRAEFVESRTQLVTYNTRTALPHDRCWSPVCAKELTKYQTAAGPIQTLLDFSTRVGMDHSPPGGRALHRLEINNVINLMQCGAAQCHAMHAPTWCLSAFHSLFAMHLKSEPKNVLSHAPYKSSYFTGTLLGIRSIGPPSRDVLLSHGFCYCHLLNH